MRSVMVSVALACGVLCSSSAFGGVGEIDPRGVFFHTFTGPSSGTEWIHIWDIEGERRYRFSDTRGVAPYDGVILPNGQITWDTLPTQSGSGMFTSQDNASQSLVFNGGTFPSTLQRAPGTDATFITRIDSREDGDSSAAGRWGVEIETLDASTGELIESEQTFVTTIVDGDLLRIELDDGTFYQGVFETGTTAGFRVIAPNALAPEFESFVGSETSWSQNLLGDFRMTGDDTFSATMLLHTRRRPAIQNQTVYRFTGSRVPTPGAMGVLGIIGIAAARRRR